MNDTPKLPMAPSWIVDAIGKRHRPSPADLLPDVRRVLLRDTADDARLAFEREQPWFGGMTVGRITDELHIGIHDAVAEDFRQRGYCAVGIEPAKQVAITDAAVRSAVKKLLESGAMEIEECASFHRRVAARYRAISPAVAERKARHDERVKRERVRRDAARQRLSAAFAAIEDPSLSAVHATVESPRVDSGVRLILSTDQAEMLAAILERD